MDSKYILIYCTVPNAETAEEISRALVEEKLAACCNIVRGIKSIYSWENMVQADNELLLLIKSTKRAFGEIEQRILELHPYKIPEILATSITMGNHNYLEWVDKNVK